jgi:hypothetical protein
MYHARHTCLIHPRELVKALPSIHRVVQPPPVACSKTFLSHAQNDQTLHTHAQDSLDLL